MIQNDWFHTTKVSGGVVGVIQNESALNRYFLIAPELLRILDSFCVQFGVNGKEAKEHYQLRGTMAKSIFQRSTKMNEAIVKHIGNPFSDRSKVKDLLSIASKTLMPQEHEVCKRNEVGKALYDNFVKSLLSLHQSLASKSL